MQQIGMVSSMFFLSRKSEMQKLLWDKIAVQGLELIFITGLFQVWLY